MTRQCNHRCAVSEKSKHVRLITACQRTFLICQPKPEIMRSLGLTFQKGVCYHGRGLYASTRDTNTNDMWLDQCCLLLLLPMGVLCKNDLKSYHGTISSQKQVNGVPERDSSTFSLLYQTCLTWKDQNQCRKVEVKCMDEQCNAFEISVFQICVVMFYYTGQYEPPSSYPAMSILRSSYPAMSILQ